MGKRLTEESLIKNIYNEETKELLKIKFEVTLTADVHNNLIKYCLLTDRATKRNKIISDLIQQKLEGKVLENTFIDLYQNPYYFNMDELLEKETVIATKNEPLSNTDKIFVVRRVPNNLDDFNKDFETYCFGDNKNIHAGYFILPQYKDHKRKHFTFLYNSEKEEIEINLVNPNNLDIVFNPLDDDKQKIKKELVSNNMFLESFLESNSDIWCDNLNYNLNVMYKYDVNIKLHELDKKKNAEGLTDEEEAEKTKLLYEGIFFK